MSKHFLFLIITYFSCLHTIKCQQINSVDINQSFISYVKSEYNDSIVKASSNLIPYPGEKGNIKNPVLIFKTDLRSERNVIQIIEKDFSSAVYFQTDSLLLAKEILCENKITPCSSTIQVNNKNILGTIIIKGIYLLTNKKNKREKVIFLHVLKISGINTAIQREEIIHTTYREKQWFVTNVIATMKT